MWICDAMISGTSTKPSSILCTLRKLWSRQFITHALCLIHRPLNLKHTNSSTHGCHLDLKVIRFGFMVQSGDTAYASLCYTYFQKHSYPSVAILAQARYSWSTPCLLLRTLRTPRKTTPILILSGRARWRNGSQTWMQT